MRLYGIENFCFEVIEELPLNRELLTEREQYWINYYNTLDPQYGYNETPAIDAKRGENSNWALLTQAQVMDIIKLLKERNLTISEIASQFYVSSSCIEDINNGRSWYNSDYTYPIRTKAKSIGHSLSTSQFSTNDIMTMRHRYVNESITDILKDYPQLTISGLKKILYGQTYKFLPYYKKREKQWIYPDN